MIASTFAKFFLVWSFSWLLAAGPCSGTPAEERPPNIIILFADDLGYGDLGCCGHPAIRTPHLDRMAREGLRFTQFYAAAPVCTPSRAALLTGRWPVRTGMASDKKRVLSVDSAGGLQDGEITIAEALKAKGYATACIGKWHLGHLPKYLPTRQGFDFYFGLPYSNDMGLDRGALYLLRGEEVIENPVQQETLTRRYTEEGIGFIRKNQEHLFFLYLPYTFPHVPLHASDAFKGKSPRGLYGDVVEELDWSAGQVFEALRDLGLAQRTFVFFTSDNGPWLTQKENGGSAGLLRGGKGSTWEGGMRVPAIAWWPGRIPAGAATLELACTLDLFNTCLELGGAPIPADRPIDGNSLIPVLLARGASARELFFYYRDVQLMAARKGPWKLHLMTQEGYGQKSPEVHQPPLLFNLHVDSSERFDVAREHPDIVAGLLKELERHRQEVVPAPSQLEIFLASRFEDGPPQRISRP